MFWSIGSCMENNRYTDNQNYTEKCCLSQGPQTVLCRDFTLTPEGAVGNGWQGSYLEVDGKVLCKDFTLGPMKEEILFGKKMQQLKL